MTNSRSLPPGPVTNLNAKPSSKKDRSSDIGSQSLPSEGMGHVGVGNLHQEINFEDHVVSQLEHAGWLLGDQAQYDRERALYPSDVIDWIMQSAPQAWEKLQRLHGSGAELAILDRLVKCLDSKTGGTIDVIRRGFSIAGGSSIAMSQALPEDTRNASASHLYATNRLRVVRQVRYSTTSEQSIDLVLFVNGIPVATVELKTDFTQSVEAAMEQYRSDRKPKIP